MSIDFFFRSGPILLGRRGKEGRMGEWEEERKEGKKAGRKLKDLTFRRLMSTIVDVPHR